MYIVHAHMQKSQQCHAYIYIYVYVHITLDNEYIHVLPDGQICLWKSTYVTATMACASDSLPNTRAECWAWESRMIGRGFPLQGNWFPFPYSMVISWPFTVSDIDRGPE